MKKGTLITLSGFAFTLEESAYEKLNRYLNQVRAYFAHYEDRDEIIADIENRIAEQFIATLSSQKQVITETDVGTVVSLLGKPEEFGEEEAKTQAKSDATYHPYQPGRKLFRDSEHAIIGGVCSGLGAYLGIDPVLIRILFLILLFSGTFGFWLYLILWLSLPEAKTVTDRMEMQGEPITLENIRASINTKSDETFEKRQSLGQSLGEALKATLPLILSLLGGVMIFAAAVGIFSLSMATIALTFLGDSSNLFFAPFPNFPSTTLHYLGLILAYIVAAIPLLFLCFAGLSFLRRKVFPSGPVVLSLLGIWFLAVLGGTALVAREAPAVQQAIENATTTSAVSLAPFSKVVTESAMQVKIQHGSETRVEVRGLQDAVDSLQATSENDTLTLRWRSGTRFCIFCSEPLVVEVTTPTLTEVTTRDATSVTASGFRDTPMTVSLEDASRLTLEGSGPSLTATLRDASRLDATDFQAATVSVTARDVSRASVWVTSNLTGTLHDIAKLEYKGSPSTTNIPDRRVEKLAE